jgi:hypothetical protein
MVVIVQQFALSVTLGYRRAAFAPAPRFKGLSPSWSTLLW